MMVMSKERHPALAVIDLTKVYRGSERPALDGLDITISAGEIFGLLGPNGAGKTTAISIMSTILRPSSGRVLVFGSDVRLDGDLVKQQIGLVPQEIALYQQLTVKENLSYYASLYGFGGSERRRRIEECLEFTGLQDKADQLLDRCSGGMKRRANLAAGILHRPKLLFLDEPTVGIDAQSRDMILERLKMLNEQGTTMVYTTHYMEEAERLCSEVAIMDDGRVILQGRPEQLMSEGEHTTLQDLFFSLTGRKLRE
jgi:ABC-2 type transport system ATP-binding protein